MSGCEMVAVSFEGSLNWDTLYFTTLSLIICSLLLHQNAQKDALFLKNKVFHSNFTHVVVFVFMHGNIQTHFWSLVLSTKVFFYYFYERS